MNVRKVGIRQYLTGVGGHLAGGMSDVGAERCQHDGSRSKSGASYPTLALIPMALVAAILGEETLAVLGVGGEGQRPQNQNQRRSE